ncbi:glucose-6-phosphate isomerase [Desulforhopalus vacuolatus]|uniref:glucose-6-phosphate isomerase n=1 Tax=Desulforhopalus vacuolatus TaxID=40414 RepID=UPI001962A0D6|nr:glucose-6-phosphate isomerase [Desulforhopalus vacuolatus]MBM9518415.1 glucose-6-phosphate isomerase [Desulforhopalus vacuolatus]
MIYHNFQETSVYNKLRQLAGAPPDLTAKNVLTAGNRLEKYVCRTPILNLHYATQRVDEEVLNGLQTMADELKIVEQFKAMRRGAVMNTIEDVESENRQVLHTSSRDHFHQPPCEPAAAAQSKAELEKLKRFLGEVTDGTLTGSTGKCFTTVIHLGIGGSDLGPRALYEALLPYGIEGRSVHFISNVDPDDAARRLGQVNLEECLVVTVSKSGGTLETLTNETVVQTALRDAGLDPKKHCVAVTGEKSPLDNPESYLRSFYMFDYIGGRYSATSMVGAVSLGFFLGFEGFMSMLEGADEMDRLAEGASLQKNPALLLALLGVWNHNFLGYPTVAVLPYSQGLHRFPAHLQQCDMESNGKSITRDGKKVTAKTGPIIWGEPGTNGQHAFYQLLHQGTEIVPVEFIGFQKSQYGHDLKVQGTTSQQKLLANLYAQSVAFAIGQTSDNPNRVFAGNRPSTIIMGQRLDPRSLGALLALYEAKIVLQGFCWNINSFDQEGVQLGKVLAGGFLKQMEAGNPPGDGIESRFLKAVLQGED